MIAVYCSHCRRAERRELADWSIRGRLNGRPYRANLCNDHLTVVADDNDLVVISQANLVKARAQAAAEVARRRLSVARRTLPLTPAGLAELDRLQRECWATEIDSHATA